MLHRFIINGLLCLSLTFEFCIDEALTQPIDRSSETEAAVSYDFTPEDKTLLNEIQRGCFDFLWHEVGDPVPLVKDRLTVGSLCEL